jgi:hypothetical protein
LSTLFRPGTHYLDEGTRIQLLRRPIQGRIRAV